MNAEVDLKLLSILSLERNLHHHYHMRIDARSNLIRHAVHMFMRSIKTGIIVCINLSSVIYPFMNRMESIRNRSITIKSNLRLCRIASRGIAYQMRKVFEPSEGVGVACADQAVHNVSKLLQRFARKVGSERRISSQIRRVSERGAIQFHWRW